MFPQKIILGRLFKKNIPGTSLGTINKIDLKSATFDSLKPYLDRLNISHLLCEGNIIEKNEISGLIQNLNNDLEIVEFDDVISLYKILEEEQQREIENIILNNSKIIMTGITDLKDLDNNNTEHYKRINVEPSLENENYEVFGSIISKDNLKSKDFFATFGLYDFNGFSVMINKLAETNVDIRECHIFWMIIGNPSSVSVFSPRNRKLQVSYIKKSITIQPYQNNSIEVSCQLSQEDTISVNAYYTTTNYVPINIQLVGWSKNCINFLPDLNICSDGDADSLTIDVHICILPSNPKSLKIDNMKEERHLNLIGDTLTKDNGMIILSIFVCLFKKKVFVILILK